jgi:hypothetical protein
MVEQVIQLAGAIVVLAAFVLSQQRRLSPDSVTYLLMNAVGAGVLAVLAGLSGDLGFLLLEGVWAIYSTWRLKRVLVPRPA